MSLWCRAAGKPWLINPLSVIMNQMHPHKYLYKLSPSCREVCTPLPWAYIGVHSLWVGLFLLNRGAAAVGLGTQRRIICAGSREKVITLVGFFCTRDMLYFSWCPIHLPFFRNCSNIYWLLSGPGCNRQCWNTRRELLQTLFYRTENESKRAGWLSL